MLWPGAFPVLWQLPALWSERPVLAGFAVKEALEQSASSDKPASLRHCLAQPVPWGAMRLNTGISVSTNKLCRNRAISSAVLQQLRIW